MKGWKLTPEWEYAYIGMREIVQHAGIHYEAMTMSNDGIHPSLHRLPGVGVSHSWIGHDRAGTLPEQQVKEQALQRSPRFSVPIKCNKMPNYDQHVVLPNGDVVLCCMDYDMKHVIGNLKEKTMDEIRRDEPYKQILAENAQNAFSNNSLCRTCTEAAPR
jgi:radical SAM protein with 4Fe4S-binding SPASM domain